MSNQSCCEAALDPNFVETINLLNKTDVPYWVCHGTLLGLIRDGNLIPWDHDIDIALWAGAIPKESLIKLMEGNGYLLKNDGSDYDFVSFTKTGGREVDFNYYRASQGSGVAYSEWPIFRSRLMSLFDVISKKSEYRGRYSKIVGHLHFLSPLIGFIVILLKKKGWFYKSAGYTTPADYIREFEMIEISSLKVRVPCFRRAVLEYIYGKDWHIPKRQYDWKNESPSTRVSNSRFK
jgi:hypothetical protein